MHYKYIEGRFNMKSIMIASVLVLSLSACVTNQQGGAVLGGVGGGILGNTIGKGSGNTAATIGGAILGTIGGSVLGQSVDTQDELLRRENQRRAREVEEKSRPVIVYERDGYSNLHPNHPCAKYTNQGANAACNRGLAEKREKHQRDLENQAYKDGLNR
jgi:surface antigen